MLLVVSYILAALAVFSQAYAGLQGKHGGTQAAAVIALFWPIFGVWGTAIMIAAVAKQMSKGADK